MSIFFFLESAYRFDKYRNTLDSRKEYTKASLIFSANGEGEGYSCLTEIVAADSQLNQRNIVTHHAEDGSGVGSAIIAGMFPFCCLTYAGRLTRDFSRCL